MKPFDLEAAKRGDPVVTTAGQPVRIICFDRKNDEYCLIALVSEDDKYESLLYFTEKGLREFSPDVCEYDLRMAPKTVTKWMNVYGGLGYLYGTKEDADFNARHDAAEREACVKVEWEE